MSYEPIWVMSPCGEESGKLQGDVGTWNDGCPLAFYVGRRTAFPNSRTALLSEQGRNPEIRRALP
ncbi:hypothetical protein HRbin11_00133 [bacterium HR11]|nr:hypothetical protein HRbin11_00133 [bacterium HR11]